MFGKRNTLSLIDTIQVNISISIINFHFIDIHILFLLYLKNMDTLSIYLNNITNQLICQDNKSIFIICK